jgi:hypothetical protein
MEGELHPVRRTYREIQMGCYEEGRPENVHAERDPGILASDEGLSVG